MFKGVLTIIIILFILIVIGAFLGMRLQRRILFPASKDVYRTPESAFSWPYEDLHLSVGAHDSTHAWFIPMPNARGTLLFSHGNAGNIADRLESCTMFRSLGLNVLVYDYGGYGLSTGAPSEKRCYQDIRAAWGWLIQKGIPPAQIVLFGRSLGGGATAQLATEVTPGATVLESTFISIPEMARKWCFGLRLDPLLLYRFNNAAKVSRIASPLLITHGREDSLIPFYHGETLFTRAHEPKQFLEIHGDHWDGFVLSKEAWLKGMDAFLTPILGPAAQS